MNGISALVKETPQSSLPLSTMLEKTAIWNQEGSSLTRNRISWCLGLGLPCPQNHEEHISVVYKPRGLSNAKTYSSRAFQPGCSSLSVMHLRVVCVVAYTEVYSFLLPRSSPLCGWDTACPSIQSPAEGQLGSCQFLATMSQAAILW